MTQIEIQTMNAVQSVNRKMRNQNETDGIRSCLKCGKIKNN